MLFALSADRSNSQSDFCGKGPFFLERVTYFDTLLGMVGTLGVRKREGGCSAKA